MLSAKKYVYYLPGENNSAKEFEASVNSLIIIGANGSGKSKLGAWMERQNGEDVHRIGAQRSLNFSEHVPGKATKKQKGSSFTGARIAIIGVQIKGFAGIGASRIPLS